MDDLRGIFPDVCLFLDCQQLPCAIFYPLFQQSIMIFQFLEEAERKRLEELERQKALLNDVLDSLKNASEDTRNLSAGSEDIQEEYEEIDIED